MIGSYGLDIARGAERNYAFEHKFGANPNLTSGNNFKATGSFDLVLDPNY